jgi:RNA polymerase sigma-70 factor (ECF subfamily)
MNDKAEPTVACLSDPAAEQVLVVAAKNGDGQAFETLFKCYRQKVLRVVLRYTRVREDAEDIVQQSFQKAFVYLHKFEGKSSFSTWLTRIAINESLMLLRQGRALREVSVDDHSEAEGNAAGLEMADSSPDPEANYARRERVQILTAELGNLRPGLRRAIELRELAELSTEQTAQHMGLSVGAVKARVFHGRRKLRERLRRYMTSPRVLKKGSSRHGGAARISRSLLTSVVSA